MSLMLPPIFANFAQFSEIIKYKAINLQFYIIKYLEYDTICAIVQDWINPANMIAFYAIHSKLTNIIRIYFKHCSDNGRKSEERAKSIRAVHSSIPQYLDYISHKEKIKYVKIYYDINFMHYNMPHYECKIQGTNWVCSLNNKYYTRPVPNPRLKWVYLFQGRTSNTRLNGIEIFQGRTSKVDEYYEEMIKINWFMREYFAVFSAALVNFLKKNKIRTNKAGQVFFTQKFNKHISKYL